MWGIILLCFCLMSCKTKYVSVPEYHTEYLNKEVHDTLIEKLFQKDSVVLYTKGDTVYRDKFQVLYKDRYNTIEKADTLIRVDSVRIPYPVERQLTKWERVQMSVGAVVLPILATCMVLLFIWVILKIRRKIL